MKWHNVRQVKELPQFSGEELLSFTRKTFPHWKMGRAFDIYGKI